MAQPEKQSAENGAGPAAVIDVATLGAIWNRVRAQAAADPFSNPILLFALDLSMRIDRGDLDLELLETLVQRLTMEAFEDRAQRIAHYLGEVDVGANDDAITALIEQRARDASFEEFHAALSRTLFGAVFTAHPSFSISHKLEHILVELATGHTIAGAP